jgi:hypothetical protein
MAEQTELQQELAQAPGLEKQLRRLADTGVCSIAPNVFGAMVRLGVFDQTTMMKAGAARARELVAQIEEAR